MPEEMERKLRKEAIRRRLKGKRRDAFIYGTMRKTGWQPNRDDNDLPEHEAMGGNK